MYAPFLLVLLVQALLIGIYPSTGTDRSVSASGFDADQFGPAPTVGDGSPTAPGATVPGATPGSPGAGTSPGGGGTTGGAVPGSPGTPGPAAPGGTVPGGGGGGGGGGGEVAAGDTSHCVGDRQFDIFAVPFENPRCIPKWPEGADNGGATWTGVTADKIKVIIMEADSSEAVDAALAPQGLASTDAEREQVNVAATGFINKYYETYGRTIEFIRYPSQCPTSPFDVPACIADTRRVIEMQPFAVFFAQPSYPELFEELSRAGILSIGGWHFRRDLFTERRPFRWDIFVDGTTSAEFMIEYYCKKLAGKNASHSGANIHPLVGARGAVERKLGIVVPESPAYRPDADVVLQGVRACGSEAEVVTYTQNIDQASQEAAAVTSTLINEGVTTVLCMCDPIFPVFLTSQHSSAGYFPEHMMSGTNLLDADQVGRLYTSEQWIHAFGPSHLADTRPFEDEQVSRVFADQGMGRPCNSCNLPWVYYSLLAAFVHNAGPNLTPGTVESGIFANGRTRGDGQVIGLGFGPGDYAAIDDIREAYWVPTATSQVDGRQGSYRSTNSGKRYALGEFPSTFDVPVEPTAG